MKKQLLATSAMVAAGVLASQAAFAEAMPIELKVGGYHEHWVGYANFAPPLGVRVSDVDIQQDGEIHFEGSSTMDNGLTFGVNVQLEAESEGDQIDESYVFVRGDFGEILLGSENGAAYAMHNGFGSFGVGATMNSGDLGQWYGGNHAYQLSGTYQGLRNRDNDSTKIRWISPRVSGFQLGADYSPENRQDDDRFPTEAKNHGNAEEQIWSVGANYIQTFDAFKVTLAAGFQGIGDGNDRSGEDPYSYGFALRLGYGGFEFSTSWTHENDIGATGAVANNRIGDRDVVGGSVGYSDGPMRVGLDVAYGWQDYEAAGTSETRQISVQLGGTYVLGPGVEARGSIFYADTENDNGFSGRDNDGFAVVSGLRLVF